MTWTKWENWHKPISMIKRMSWCMSNVLDSYITQCQNLRLIGVQMTIKISLDISLNTWCALLFPTLKEWGSPQKVARNICELCLRGQKPLNYIKSQSTRAKGLIEKVFCLKTPMFPILKFKSLKWNSWIKNEKEKLKIP